MMDRLMDSRMNMVLCLPYKYGGENAGLRKIVEENSLASV